MTGSLANRTIMISGASSGIGAHLAKVLARAGAKVVLGARRNNRVMQLARDISADGHCAMAVTLDVTSETSIAHAFDQAALHFHSVDTVIANAGISSAGRSTEIAAEALHSVFDTNLLGVYLFAREAAKRMIESGSREQENGRVLLIGSITADMTGQGDAAYAASKAAVAHLGRQFAREWVRQGINVNTIQPGYIQTELSGDWFNSEGGEKQIAGWHRRRMMDIDALDDLVSYLCSDASRYVTGATFTIDDGQSL